MPRNANKPVRIDVSALPFEQRKAIISKDWLCPMCATSRRYGNHRACSTKLANMTPEEKYNYGLITWLGEETTEGDRACTVRGLKDSAVPKGFDLSLTIADTLNQDDAELFASRLVGEVFGYSIGLGATSGEDYDAMPIYNDPGMAFSCGMDF